MNIKQLLATVAVFSATASAFAQQTEYVDPAVNFVSTKTRAEVIAELKQSQANGTYVAGGTELPGFVPVLAKTIPADSDTRYADNGKAANGAKAN